MGRRKPGAAGAKRAEGKPTAKTVGPQPPIAPPPVATPPRGYGHWIALGVLLALVLFSRIGTFSLVYSKHPARILSPDSAAYDQPAQALLKTGRFAINPDHPEMPEFVRTPGYPLFIAANYRIFGINHAPVILTQILLSTVAIVVIFLLCLGLCGPRGALLAALMMALEPVSFLYSQIFLSDMLYMVLVALIAAAGVRLIQARETEIRWAWLLGLAIAVSAHLRPISYYLILPVLAGMLAAKRVQASPPRRLLALGAGLALPWVMLVGGWQVRNAVKAGTAEFSAIQSVNLLLYRAAGVVALRDRIPFEAAQKKVVADLGEREKLPPAECYRVYRQEGLKLLREHPRLTLEMMYRGLYLLLLTPSDDELKSYIGQSDKVDLFQQWRKLPLGQFYELWVRKHFRSLLINLFFMRPLSGLLYLGVVFALLFMLWEAKQRGLTRETVAIHLYLAGLIVYLAILSAGPEANNRFRLPLVPLLAIYAAIGWDALMHGIGFLWRKKTLRNAQS